MNKFNKDGSFKINKTIRPKLKKFNIELYDIYNDNGVATLIAVLPIKAKNKQTADSMLRFIMRNYSDYEFMVGVKEVKK